jgi:CheY-like chemotaxis protein
MVLPPSIQGVLFYSPLLILVPVHSPIGSYSFQGSARHSPIQAQQWGKPLNQKHLDFDQSIPFGHFSPPFSASLFQGSRSRRKVGCGDTHSILLAPLLRTGRLARELRPDIIVMEARMPKLDGVEAIRQVKAERPEASILILTMYDEEEYVMELIRAGAAGYLLKSTYS